MSGICDQVAIVGMGCIQFGEHWDKGTSDMVIEAVNKAVADAGIDIKNIDAVWVGSINELSGHTVSEPLKLDNKPVTRVENFCCTGSEAMRNAAFSVACGAYDVVLAVGVEKLKDAGGRGLDRQLGPEGTKFPASAPAAFAMIAASYFAKYGVDPIKGKEALARIAWKNHKNGALNPLAQFQKEMSMEAILKSPLIADPLGVLDCSGVCDGAAAAILVRSKDAYKYRKDPVYIKGMSIAAGPGRQYDPTFDFTSFKEVTIAAADAYKQAGVTDPLKQIGMCEVHDCFTPTEMVLVEDLGFSERGQAWKDYLDGKFDLNSVLSVNPDGGLKSFGHPIGASGIRMAYEMYLQLQGRAGKRQIDNPKLGLTNNIGGFPWHNIAFVSVLGNKLS